ncbi:M23 family metallopeptidase [Rhizobium sp. SAFR-030]|uniref:M23 family metallopeptidase n=1 Tax=Rhizobium sp. SAFR-030 TaxID=3387277 RepID=UPI003F7D0729
MTLARTRRQPVSMPKKGRVWMPALSASAKLDLIERMEDGSFGRFAYFDIPLEPHDHAPAAEPDRLAAYQEPAGAVDPFGLVLRAGETAERRRPGQTAVTDTLSQMMPATDPALNVSVAPVRASRPVRRLVALPAHAEPIAAIEGAVDVPAAEFEHLARQLGSQTVQAGEELDLLIGEHPAQPGVSQIVFARHTSPKGGERLLARRDDGGFQEVQDRHLYDRLLAEAFAGDGVGKAASAEEPEADRKLRRVAAGYPHLVDQLAQARVPADVGLQVVGLLQANAIRWERSKAPPISDVVFRSREDGERELVSVSVHIGGKDRQFYRYAGSRSGRAEFFDDEGHSVSKTLMHKPVAAGQIGDGFGWRVHPILQTRKFHNGVDFRAPQGSPIVAAGDGVVEKISFEDGYGKYVRIHHDGGYSTTYAHIEKAADALKVGQRVAQGQVIAYVGSTGLSTGPHLYYELRVGNNYADPTKAQMPAGTVLRGRALDAFHQQVDRVEAIASAIRTSAHSAASAVGEALRPAAGPTAASAKVSPKG